MIAFQGVAGRSIFSALAIWLTVTSLMAESCLHCKQKPRPWPTRETRSTNGLARSSSEISSQDELLNRVDSINNDCVLTFQVLPVDLPRELFDSVVEKVDLVTKVLKGYYPRHDQKMLRTFMEEIILSDDATPSGRLFWLGNGSLRQPDYFVSFQESQDNELKKVELDDYVLEEGIPWVDSIIISSEANYTKGKNQSTQSPLAPRLENKNLGNWSETYFLCEEKKWIISYTSLIISEPRRVPQLLLHNDGRIIGLMSVDVDVTEMDVNQCDTLHVSDNASDWQMSSFLGTHKCNNRTSKCIFTPGYGWTSGSYKCQCRDGFYSTTGNPVFNGSLVESAYKDKMSANSPIYDMLYVCKKCQPGCDSCNDNSPCLSNYNWAFRISFLTISVICILLTAVLSAYVYRYRKLKVIKVASPVFLCITLLGCVIMYCEMAAIFPVLDMYSCIATKWTRHMGFCITYSALLLKTWRVSLTYRVKSAHKLKLTDKQLLQWLFPILLVMAIYLGTWTISSPPVAVYIRDWHNLKFKQCDYNWWDHSLAIGEFLFLLWGIRVCYNVRNAESFFNEAKHISWAVHSITIVNIIMVMIHLVILPNAGPDVKYLFGFFRTQLSTTITVILIFGPKFYRVIKGEGDTWDNRARARGVTASFSLNGVGPVYEEPQDLYQENEELKEEVQKLASQIEFMRIVHMEVNNRHLKPKHGGFFSQPAVNQSPIIKNMYMKFESTDSPGSRISPAAELVSERV